MKTWILVGMLLAVAGISVPLIRSHLPATRPETGAHLTWDAYSADAVQASVASGKPMLIDFYADWCVGCHQLEKTVFANPAVVARLSGVTRLRLDATKINTSGVQEVLDQYGVIGLPTVIFLDAHGKEIREARVEGAGAVEEFEHSLGLLERQDT